MDLVEEKSRIFKQISKLLQEIYPNAKLDDLEVLASLNTKKDIIQLAKDAGWDDKKINDFKL